MIPTYQRPALLTRALDALAVQTLDTDEFEIIVCDDARNDATREAVDRWRRSHAVSISYVAGSTPAQGPAAMRNAGWRIARGEVIAFTDDETIPDRDWLWQGLLALDVAAADAASGRIIVPLPDDPTDHDRDAARLERAGFVTANCFCLRRALECVRGFDARFRVASREDSDLFFQLIEYGFDVVHAIDAVVVRPVRPATWGESLRAEAKHAFDALLYKKHPDLYDRFVRPDRPLLYYAILAALAALASGTVFDSSAVALAGGGAWLALTSVLIARRLHETTRRAPHVVEVIVTSTVVPLLSVFHRIRGGIAFRVAFW